MKFYQENKINPLASCLPLLLQLPVFISLFYMLRTDLKKHICGRQIHAHYGAIVTKGGRRLEKPAGHIAPPAATVSASLGQIPVPAGHHEQGDGRGADRPDRPLRRLPGRLDARGDRHGRSEPAPSDAAVAGRLRGDPLPVPGRAARLLDHDEPVDDRPAACDPPPHGRGRSLSREGTQRRASGL